MPELKAKKVEIKHLGWHAFPVNEKDRVVLNTFHARYIIGGSQTGNKVYSFFHHYFHFPWLTVSTSALHTNTFQGIYYLTIKSKFIFAFRDWASLKPLPYSCAMTSE